MVCLRRFADVLEDDTADGHCESKEDMRALAELGAVRITSFGRSYLTDFGRFLLASAAAAEPAGPLTEEDVERQYKDGILPSTHLGTEIAIMNSIKHSPLHAPRAGTPGEGLYLKLWQGFVENEPTAFADIFRNMLDPIDQRIVSIAASFMVFMGCNGGHSFTWLAKDLASRGVFNVQSEAFLAAFAIENRREYGINHGLRLVEAMLHIKHPIDYDNYGRDHVIWGSVPDLNRKDMDAIECMVIWWSTSRAEEMRAIAEPLIIAANRDALAYPGTPTVRRLAEEVSA